MKRLRDWYDHPEYYEAIFGADSEKELDFLVALNARFGTGGKTWLEPACGAGRLLEVGARRGLRLTGYDLNEKMLAYAAKRLSPALRRRVTLHQARMETFCPPALRGTFDLAFNLVSTFRYLDSDEAARAHLACVRRLLKPGGLYVLGFHVTDYARKHLEHERWVGTHRGAKVVCNTREWAPERAARRSRMRNRLRITGAGEELLIETEWYFRTYDGRQALELVRASGLEVVALYDFDYALDAPSSLDTDRLDWVLVLTPRKGGARRR